MSCIVAFCPHHLSSLPLPKLLSFSCASFPFPQTPQRSYSLPSTPALAETMKFLAAEQHPLSYDGRVIAFETSMHDNRTVKEVLEALTKYLVGEGHIHKHQKVVEVYSLKNYNNKRIEKDQVISADDDTTKWR